MNYFLSLIITFYYMYKFLTFSFLLLPNYIIWTWISILCSPQNKELISNPMITCKLKQALYSSSVNKTKLGFSFKYNSLSIFMEIKIKYNLDRRKWWSMSQSEMYSKRNKTKTRHKNGLGLIKGFIDIPKKSH